MAAIQADLSTWNSLILENSILSTWSDDFIILCIICNICVQRFGFFFCRFCFFVVVVFFFGGGIYFQLCIKLKSFGEFDRCILVRLKVHKKNMLLE